MDEAVRLLMKEDQEDIASIKERKDESEISYESLLDSLEADCKI